MGFEVVLEMAKKKVLPRLPSGRRGAARRLIAFLSGLSG